MSPRSEKVERVRIINDEMRAGGPASTETSKWLTTLGVRSLGDETVAIAVSRVRDFERFDDGNDPYGEHDFGSFSIEDQLLFWKIDYYDLALNGRSEDPADEAKTCRVLTLMLASEY
jgi:hypothetical protein